MYRFLVVLFASFGLCAFAGTQSNYNPNIGLTNIVKPFVLVITNTGTDGDVPIKTGDRLKFGTPSGGVATNGLPTNSVPWVRVFPDGTAYNQAGKITTTGTKTAGINEAIHALYQTNGLGLIVGGGRVLLEAGIYDCTTNITIPNQFNFELQIDGAGKSSTLIIDSTVGTNFLILEKTTGGDAANGGTKPFQGAFRNIGFSKRYDTNLTALVYLNTKVNQTVFENCAFSSLQCIQYTGVGQGNVQGQGGGLLFIGGTPTNAVGTVGIRIDGGTDNKSLIRKCDFYGLAAGIIDAQDHATIEDCMFSEIGKWWSGASSPYTAHYGTAWNVVSNGLTSSGLTNTLHVGAGIISTAHIYDMQIENCYFMDNNAGIANINLTTAQPQTLKIINPYWETCQYQIIHGVDQDDDGSAMSEVILTYETAQVSMPINYIRLTNGVVSTTPPSTLGNAWAYHFGDNWRMDDLAGNKNVFIAIGANGLVQFNGSQVTNMNAGELRSGTTALARGGTGASLSDPNYDSIPVWDDTDNAISFAHLGNGFTWTHGTHTVSVSDPLNLSSISTATFTATQYLNSISLFSGPTNNYDLSKSLQHYITFTPCAITGFVGSGSTPGLQPNSQLVISNAASTNITFTFTSSITTPDGARAYTVTNGTIRRFSFGTSTNTAGSMIAYTNVNPLNTYY